MGILTDLITGLSLANDHGRSKWLADEAGLTETDVVLDIGCGPGTALAEIKRRGAKAIGLDPSPTMLWLAARRAGKNVVLLSGTAEDIALPCDSVTVAWATGSFHHWSDPDAGLAEVNRVLAPGGRLFIVEREANGRGFHAMHAISPVRAESLVEQLSAAGFVGARHEKVTLGKRPMLLARAAVPTDASKGQFGDKQPPSMVS